MGVLDKFLNIMKLDDDYDDEDDLFDDDEFDDYEPKSKKTSFRKKEEEYDDFEMQPSRKSRSMPAASSKVTPMRQPNSRRNNTVSMEVCVIRPTSVEDEREVTETLLSGRTVILNLEGMDLEIAQRIVDFISGATYAISGNLQKISNYIFLITPMNVEITGDLQVLLNSSSDIPAIHSRF